MFGPCFVGPTLVPVLTGLEAVLLPQANPGGAAPRTGHR